MCQSTIVVLLCLTQGESGLSPEDFEASVATLKSIADTIGASCVKLRERLINGGMTAQYLVRQQAEERDFTEIRYCYRATS